jgi:phosphatidate cytidylyltransferase
MSPHAALHSLIFHRYFEIVLAILAIAGVVLAMLDRFTSRDVAPIWRTYRGWLVMIGILIAAVFLGRVVVIVGVTLLSIYGFKEFARATGLYRDWWMTGATYVTIIAVGIVSLIRDPYDSSAFGWFGLFMAMPVFCINFLLIVPILRNQSKGQLQLVALSIFGFMYMGWMFGHVGFLADSGNPYGYLLFILLATELNDVGAFTFGKLLGHRQLRGNISPRKTWGGAIGAIGVSLIIPWLLRFSLPGFSTRELILTGLIVGVGGQLGDLCISFIKRDIGIKDMGSAIPGHGGILDRIDSLIFVAPLFLHTVDYFNGLR